MTAGHATEGPAQSQSQSQVGIVIVAHDGLAQALKATLEHIMGPVPCVLALGVSDADEELRARIIEAVKEVDSGAGVVIAADMHGSTPCNFALQASCEAGISVEVAAGANLPMLVALAENRSLSPVAAVEAALQQARRCLLRSSGCSRDHGRG